MRMAGLSSSTCELHLSSMQVTTSPHIFDDAHVDKELDGLNTTATTHAAQIAGMQDS
eukprot:COSAG02_NODE_646_length_18945_cov_17.654462_8_plen_57_part_00